MLDAFVTENRDEIIRRCRQKAALRSKPTLLSAELDYGVPRFLDQLVEALRNPRAPSAAIGASAAIHGHDRQVQGFTVSQVVHDYGDVCQAITDLALQLHVRISVEDFRTLNRCLDDAIASAVSEYGRDEAPAADANAALDHERLGFLEHEIRNLVGTASIAFEVLRTGNVGVGGSTGAVLRRSLDALRDLINRSVSEFRLRHSLQSRTQFDIGEFIADLVPGAELEASAHGLVLYVETLDGGARVDADRPVLAAVVMNLLQNAFKFTGPATTVTLRTSATADHVLIEVEDECGGLPEGEIESLFRPFEQRGADRTGLGLGLAMGRWGTEVNNGRISARNLANHGCVFTVDLPRVAVLAVHPRRLALVRRNSPGAEVSSADAR
jgi:signal transduction histidine kinase